MFTPGLVSITFRKQTVPEIIRLVQKAKLKSIEWGGDVHVPPGNKAAARDAYQRTFDAGLSVAAYGSYYRVGQSEKEQAPFDEVLESAVVLQAPTIRVWAGTVGSPKADAATRAHIVTETQRIAEMAQQAKISISFEFHGNTLTDTNESALALLDEVNHSNVFSLWQPAVGISREYAIEGLQALLPRVTNIHVFSWMPDSNKRLPLADGADRWNDYLKVVRTTGRDHHVLMEFVRDDSPDNFFQDAAVLHQWVEQNASDKSD
jgi:3-dehydroshikimate dehydratase